MKINKVEVIGVILIIKFTEKYTNKLFILQRVGKVTINELRKRNMTGEQLRRIMWGRESLSTPVKKALYVFHMGSKSR